jgi:hypothetical protein
MTYQCIGGTNTYAYGAMKNYRKMIFYRCNTPLPKINPLLKASHCGLRGLNFVEIYLIV